jgi:CRP-like cAMP-binding protein
MSDQARMRCLAKMQCLTAEAGDMVEDLHTISHSIYIIERGTVQLLTDEGAVMLTVTNGDIFGEMSSSYDMYPPPPPHMTCVANVWQAISSAKWSW